MYQPPNPVEAARQTVQQAAQHLYAHATPKPKESPYTGGWDGRHCAFIYTAECLLHWPRPPRFK